jgi:hypothetical protein
VTSCITASQVGIVPFPGQLLFESEARFRRLTAVSPCVVSSTRRGSTLLFLRVLSVPGGAMSLHGGHVRRGNTHHINSQQRGKKESDVPSHVAVAEWPAIMEDRLFANDAAVIRGPYAVRIRTRSSLTFILTTPAGDWVSLSALWLGKDSGKRARETPSL